MAIVCVGIDLAKNVFAVHGINEAGRPELVRPAVPRDKLLALVSALPPCVIGMEGGRVNVPGPCATQPLGRSAVASTARRGVAPLQRYWNSSFSTCETYRFV